MPGDLVEKVARALCTLNDVSFDGNIPDTTRTAYLADAKAALAVVEVWVREKGGPHNQRHVTHIADAIRREIEGGGDAEVSRRD